MADKETFQKEMRARLKEWSKRIDELRAEGEKMLERDNGDLINLANKGQIIFKKFLEAKKEIDELTKADNATWEKHRANIENISNELNHLWESLF
jgi:gamma-glutamylcysteine synthetase